VRSTRGDAAPVLPSSSAPIVAATGFVEGITYLVLLAAALWRGLLDGPDLAAVVGLVHGIAFLVYAAAVLDARRRAGWSATATLSLLVASALPAGGFVVARRMRPHHPA
jgi:integral membrane protein